MCESTNQAMLRRFTHIEGLRSRLRCDPRWSKPAWLRKTAKGSLLQPHATFLVDDEEVADGSADAEALQRRSLACENENAGLRHDLSVAAPVSPSQHIMQ